MPTIIDNIKPIPFIHKISDWYNSKIGDAWGTTFKSTAIKMI